jgi:hypothetical protein
MKPQIARREHAGDPRLSAVISGRVRRESPASAASSMRPSEAKVAATDCSQAARRPACGRQRQRQARAVL